MDLRKIVENNEAEIAARELAAKNDHEAKINAETTLRRLNADKLQISLREIVKPSLQEAVKQLSSMGYQGRVSETTSEEPAVGISRIIVGVELEFQGKRLLSPGSMKGRYLLQYEGDVRKGVITAIEQLHGGATVLNGGHNIPIDDLSKETVEKHLEGFVERAFKVESGER